MAAISPRFRPATIAFTACLPVVLQSISVQAADDLFASFELNGDAVAGRAIYLRHCASCHGPKGAGDGQEGRAFEPGPSDFTASEPDARRFYLATRDGGMAVGLNGTMPVFRHTLDDDEIHDVVAYLMRVAK